MYDLDLLLLHCNIIPNLFGITTFKPNFLFPIKNTCFNNKYYKKNTTSKIVELKVYKLMKVF
jgi:hypothetical protein